MGSVLRLTGRPEQTNTFGLLGSGTILGVFFCDLGVARKMSSDDSESLSGTWVLLGVTGGLFSLMRILLLFDSGALSPLLLVSRLRLLTGGLFSSCVEEKEIRSELV